MSFNYYNQNSRQFFTDTFALDMSNIYTRFLQRLPLGCNILDVGCGSGRDALYFHCNGYNVDAFDASREMVKLASLATGLSIKHSTFQNFNTVHSFDGIWACASLLHLPKKEHAKIISKYYGMLTSGGTFYMSFKYGTEDYDKNERHFSCHDETSISDLLGKALTKFETDVWVTDDVRKDRPSESWLNILLFKNGNCHQSNF